MVKLREPAVGKNMQQLQFYAPYGQRVQQVDGAQSVRHAFAGQAQNDMGNDRDIAGGKRADGG